MKAASSLVRNDSAPTRSSGTSTRLIACRLATALNSSSMVAKPGRGLRTNVPVFGFSPAFVRAGALVGVGVDPAAQGQQAATLTAVTVVAARTDGPLTAADQGFVTRLAASLSGVARVVSVRNAGQSADGQAEQLTVLAALVLLVWWRRTWRRSRRHRPRAA